MVLQIKYINSLLYNPSRPALCCNVHHYDGTATLKGLIIPVLRLLYITTPTDSLDHDKKKKSEAIFSYSQSEITNNNHV